MSNIIPFESGLPSYLTTVPKAELNDDLLSHASRGYPIISIKGKVFTVSRDGEKKVLANPKDPDSPANRLAMVIVKANKGTSKVFYASGYVEGSDAKPDCFSNDGVRPDSSVEKPFSSKCDSCPKNAWGSKVSADGKKGKACSDSVRIAVAQPSQINDPYFIRVPAASIRNLGELGKMLAKRGVSYQMVVTEISFDQASATPLLQFKPIGFLDEAAYKQVKEVAESDVVQSILGGGFNEDTTTPAVTETVKEEAAKVVEKAKQEPAVAKEEVMAAVEKAEAAPAPKPNVAPTTVQQVDDLASIDLDNLAFD
jgi:hypothetical protein